MFLFVSESLSYLAYLSVTSLASFVYYILLTIVGSKESRVALETYKTQTRIGYYKKHCNGSTAAKFHYSQTHSKEIFVLQMNLL